MIRTRVIPRLLLKGQGLVKTVSFNNPKYIGDPVNAVKIFNDKEVHELVFLDITASAEKKPPGMAFISTIAGECFMPLGYGGGVRSVEQAEEIFSCGVEKVIINAGAVENPSFIRELADISGSQSIVVSIDAKRDASGNYHVFTYNGKKQTIWNPVAWAKEAERQGAGEIFLNSIDRDGMMNGYDMPLIKEISGAVSIPVVACGGARTVEDFGRAINEGGASAVAAGSMFVYYGKYKAVLINFPEDDEFRSAGLK